MAYIYTTNNSDTLFDLARKVGKVDVCRTPTIVRTNNGFSTALKVQYWVKKNEEQYCTFVETVITDENDRIHFTGTLFEKLVHENVKINLSRRSGAI